MLPNDKEIIGMVHLKQLPTAPQGRLTLDEGKELQSELKRRSQEEAKDLLGQIKEKSQSLQYATKEDLQRLEGKVDALLEQLSQSEAN